MMSSLGRRFCPCPAVSGAVAVAATTTLIFAKNAWKENKPTADGPDHDGSRDAQRPASHNRTHRHLARSDLGLDHANNLLPSPNRCTCEGGDGLVAGEYTFTLRRHRTMEMLSETSTAATLRSRYDVDWDRPLGEGAYGAVYLGTDRETGQKYALKKISKRLTNETSFMREIDALMHIRESGGHPNINGIIENFDEGGYYYLVLDLISGG